MAIPEEALRTPFIPAFPAEQPHRRQSSRDDKDGRWNLISRWSGSRDRAEQSIPRGWRLHVRQLRAEPGSPDETARCGFPRFVARYADPSYIRLDHGMTGGFPNTRFGWGMEEGYHKGNTGYPSTAADSGPWSIYSAPPNDQTVSPKWQLRSLCEAACEPSSVLTLWMLPCHVRASTVTISRRLASPATCKHAASLILNMAVQLYSYA